MQLIISQSATAVQGLIARSNAASTEEERVDTPVNVPNRPATSPGQEICVMSLIGIAEALTRSVAEVNQRVSGIVLDFTRQIEAHTTSMLANKVSMLEAFYDRLTNFGLKVDIDQKFNDLDMSQYATLDLVNNKTSAMKDLRIKSDQYGKDMARFDEWKVCTHETVRKLQDLSLQSTVVNAESDNTELL